MKDTISTNQTGRSMLEMLAVLAVIVLLSVVGLMGFRVAMVKHRANELVNEAHMRAVEIATQIALGNSNPSVDAFPVDAAAGARFGEVTHDVGSETFKISVEGVEPDVYDQDRKSVV